MVDLPNILYHDFSTDAGTNPPREDDDDDDVVVEAADELFCRRDSIVVADVHDDDDEVGNTPCCRMKPIREAFRRAIELNIILLLLY
jgi:hypothetical protein